jgi:hypothetical protein
LERRIDGAREGGGSVNEMPSAIEAGELIIPPILSFEDYERETLALYKPPFVSRYGAMTLDKLDEPGPEYEPLVDGLLSIGDRSVIGGPSRSGKSFLAIHIGMQIALGGDVFGMKCKQGLVIYQAGEGARGIKKRLRAIRKHFNVPFDKKTPFVLLRSPVDLWHPNGDTTPLIAEILAIAELYPDRLLLIVIDTLATATGGADENSGRDMGLVLQNIAKINERTGAHVMLVHHMNAGGEKLRGHTSVYANVDQVILVRNDPVTMIKKATVDKIKDEEGGANFQFELMQVELSVRDNGEKVTSCVCLPVGEKAAIRKTEEAKGWGLSRDQSFFMQIFFEVEKRHGRPIPDGLIAPASARAVVKSEDFGAAYRGATPPRAIPDDATPEKRAKLEVAERERVRGEIKRLFKSLRYDGVMGGGQAGNEWFMWHTGKPLRGFPHTLPRSEPEPEASAEDLSALDF